MNKVKIRPFHLFEYQDNHYLLNIEKMSAQSVSRGLLPFVQSLQEPQTTLTAVLEEMLKSWNLIGDGKEKGPYGCITDHAPITYMYLFLTQSCNLRCIYCYGDGGEYGTGGSMDTTTAKQAVDWLISKSGKMKKIHIGFFGGEPFLNFPLMQKIVEYAKDQAQAAQKEVSFYVTTNGTLLDDEKILFLKKHQITVQVSFDGPKEIQDAQRPYANGQGSYEDLVPKIKILLAHVPKASAHAVLWGDTNPQFIKTALQGLGFTSLSLAPASSSLFADGSEEKENIRKTQFQLRSLEEEAEAWLRHLRNRDKKALLDLISCSGGYGIYPALMALLHNRLKYHFCGVGRKIVGVSVTGDIYPCHRFVGNEDYQLGHVKDENFNQKDYLQSPLATQEKCRSCFARYYCAGGCLHDNLSSSGSPKVPSEEICHLRQRELELAAVIVSNLSSDDQSFLVNEQILPPQPCPLDF